MEGGGGEGAWFYIAKEGGEGVQELGVGGKGRCVCRLRWGGRVRVEVGVKDGSR